MAVAPPVLTPGSAASSVSWPAARGRTPMPSLEKNPQPATELNLSC